MDKKTFKDTVSSEFEEFDNEISDPDAINDEKNAKGFNKRRQIEELLEQRRLKKLLGDDLD